jgi:hypothetical protein
VPWFVSLGYLATGYLAWIVATFIAILALFRVAQRRATIALSDPQQHGQNRGDTTRAAARPVAVAAPSKAR